MRLVIALAAALVAAPALAAGPAPNMSNYQPGPRTEDGLALHPRFSNWIDIRVDKVDAAKGSDQCAVRGKVAAVYRGLRYRRGDSAVIEVPCGTAQIAPLQLSTFARFWLDRDWLHTVKRASVQLDNQGRVVSFANTFGLTRVY
jgi:hypothetical protein